MSFQEGQMDRTQLSMKAEQCVFRRFTGPGPFACIFSKLAFQRLS